MSALEPELWVADAPAAVGFYVAAFGATIVSQAGDGEDVVVRLELDGSRFWVAPADPGAGRLDPMAGGATGRILLVAEDPAAVVAAAVEAGATMTSEVGEEHGWEVGRIIDPGGHEWEIGRPSV